MFRKISAMLSASLLLLPAAAHAQNFCRTSFTPGEQIETRFMGMEYALMMFALAEKYCGAPRQQMRPYFLGHLEKHGCGPGTEIYADVEKSIAWLEDASLKRLAQGGDSKLALSDRQVREWASTAVQDLGGCEALKQGHDQGFLK
ncbi:hypothetical protein ATY76_04350 [Rhizobium sp. R339]|nr:hypothetical protein ATY76_04350 [Rhizobium sp. R339]